jgi:hypothetical protein
LDLISNPLNPKLMKSAVKPLVLFTIFSLCSSLTHAQLKKLTPPSAFALDIKKVIEDYPNRFANLVGDLVVENNQSVQYKCNFAVAGAEEASVTRYSSTQKNISSWEALMLSTESFEEAKKKFRSLFTQLNNLPVRMDNVSFTLKGEYEVPKEEMKFTTVVFSFNPIQEAVSKLKVEVAMQYELTEWKVKVMVYDREREDEERGPKEEH